MTGVQTCALPIYSIHDPAIDRMGSHHQHHIRMEVELKDGRKLSTEIEQASGGADVPIPHEAVVEKFMGLGRTVLPTARLESIVAQVETLEILPDVALLSRSMALQP